MATFSFEIELELEGVFIPYRHATWNDPAEGGYVEDLAIKDAGVLERDRSVSLPAFRWVRKSFLTGVDTSNPEVQKLLENLLALVAEDAAEAVINEHLERAA